MQHSIMGGTGAGAGAHLEAGAGGGEVEGPVRLRRGC